MYNTAHSKNERQEYKIIIEKSCFYLFGYLYGYGNLYKEKNAPIQQQIFSMKNERNVSFRTNGNDINSIICTFKAIKFRPV